VGFCAQNGSIGAVNCGIVARNGADSAVKTDFFNATRKMYPLPTAQWDTGRPFVEVSHIGDPMPARIYSLQLDRPFPRLIS